MKQLLLRLRCHSLPVCDANGGKLCVHPGLLLAGRGSWGVSLQPRHREVDSGTELIGGTGNQNPGVLRQLAFGGAGCWKGEF